MNDRLIQTASHWGVYRVATDPRGRVAGVAPAADDPCPARYVGGLPEMVHSPLRIDRPHVRAGYLRGGTGGARGADAFVPVTWERAIALVADELARVKAEHGNEAIYGGSYGWASAGRLHHGPSVLKRFLGLNGGYVDKRGNHSFGAALGIVPYVLGRADISELSASWQEILDHSELVVMFGGAAVKNTQVDPGGAVRHQASSWFERAARSGAEFVSISPSRKDLPAALNVRWQPLRPNTDTALMLALAHTLAAEGLHDQAFLARYCEGYPRFEDYLMGRGGGTPRTADWAADITGVPADAIRALARKMAARNTLVNVSWSVQRADHGEQPVWMGITLAAMLGRIGLPGCGFSLGFGAVNGIAERGLPGMPRPTLPLGPNAISTYVPVGRIADMLLNPGKTIEHDGQVLTFPDIRLVYSVGGNPFHHNANLNHFLRAWQRPDTVIVHEPWWNPAAKHADIVFPATTTLERNDILAHEKSREWIAMYKAIDPVGQARNDFDIFAELSARLGFEQAYTQGRDEMGWLCHMYETARQKAQANGFAPPEFAEFWERGRYEFPGRPTDAALLQAFRADPDRHPLATPSGRIEIHSARIADYGYDDCPPHPAWREPAEWLGSPLARRHPLHLLSNQPANRLHSQLDPAQASRQSKVSGREPIAMHPSDAAARGIRDGDVVRVFNERGAFLAGAVLAEHLMPGVLQIATGAWYDPLEGGRPGSLDKHGNPNLVTLDAGTSRLAQGSMAQTALVEIEKCDDPPPISAFELPPIAQI